MQRIEFQFEQKKKKFLLKKLKNQHENGVYMLTSLNVDDNLVIETIEWIARLNE